MYFSFAGVMSLSIEGAKRDNMVVIGEGVDAIRLTTTLMKKVGHTEIVSIEVKKGNGPSIWPDVARRK